MSLKCDDILIWQQTYKFKIAGELLYTSMKVACKRHCGSRVLPKCFQTVSHPSGVSDEKAENMEEGHVKLLLSENGSVLLYFIKPLVIKESHWEMYASL